MLRLKYSEQATRIYVWVTISHEALFYDAVRSETLWCGIRRSRWSYEVFGILPK